MIIKESYVDYNPDTGMYDAIDEEGNVYSSFESEEEAEEYILHYTSQRKPKYVVVRHPNEDHVMFSYSKDKVSGYDAHLTYDIDSTTRRSGFNDTRIVVYDDKEEAQKVATKFNNYARSLVKKDPKKYGFLRRYTNWQVEEKWW